MVKGGNNSFVIVDFYQLSAARGRVAIVADGGDDDDGDGDDDDVDVDECVGLYKN